MTLESLTGKNVNGADIHTIKVSDFFWEVDYILKESDFIYKEKSYGTHHPNEGIRCATNDYSDELKHNVEVAIQDFYENKYHGRTITIFLNPTKKEELEIKNAQEDEEIERQLDKAADEYYKESLARWNGNEAQNPFLDDKNGYDDLNQMDVDDFEDWLDPQ